MRDIQLKIAFYMSTIWLLRAQAAVGSAPLIFQALEKKYCLSFLKQLGI
jgi:hypothetical protein